MPAQLKDNMDFFYSESLTISVILISCIASSFKEYNVKYPFRIVLI